MEISQDQQDFFETMKKMFEGFEDPEKRKEIIEQHFQMIRTLNLFKKAQEEILEGKNIEHWSKDVSEAIEEVDLKILNAKGSTTGLKEVKNHLFFLKWLIAEIK